MDPAAYYQNSLSGIDQATSTLLAQYAQLQQQAAAHAQGTAQQLQGQTNQNLAAFGNATGNGARDMQAAGFDPGALNAINSLDKARLTDQGNRMQQFMQMQDINQQTDNNARNMNALAVGNGAKFAAGAQYGASLLSGAGGGGGGGGSGGYSRGGYGGSGGSDVPTQGDAGQIAKGLAELPDVTEGAGRAMHSAKGTLLLDAYLHGTHGKGLTSPDGKQQLLKGGFGHTSASGDNSAVLAGKYLNQYDALVGKGIIRDNPNQRDNFTKNLLKEMQQVQQNAKGRSKAEQARNVARNAAAMRGYDNWNQGGQDQPDLSFLNNMRDQVGAYIASQPAKAAPAKKAPAKGGKKK